MPISQYKWCYIFFSFLLPPWIFQNEKPRKWGLYSGDGSDQRLVRWRCVLPAQGRSVGGGPTQGSAGHWAKVGRPHCVLFIPFIVFVETDMVALSYSVFIEGIYCIWFIVVPFQTGSYKLVSIPRAERSPKFRCGLEWKLLNKCISVKCRIRESQSV